MRCIDDSPFHRGNRVEVFFGGDAAFESMLEAVAGAAAEILLESYILRDDATGRRFQEALVAVARRGVTVRVLADALGSFGTRTAYWREFARAGIEARLFHPLGVPLRFLRYRDHRKIVVVDRRVAYTGGMNIGDEYGSSVLPAQRVFRDTHARVDGPAAGEMVAVFREGWGRAGGSPMAIAPLEASGGPGARRHGPRFPPGTGRPGGGGGPGGDRRRLAAQAVVDGGLLRTAFARDSHPRRRGRPRRGREAAGSRKERRADRPPRRPRVLLGPPVSRREDLRVPAGHPSRQDAGRRRASHGGRVEQPRLSFVRAQRRVQLRHPRREHRCPDGRRSSSEDTARAVEIRAAPWRKRSWFHRLGDAAARRLAPLL